ncbi:hypothetical protein [Pontimicrobium sp. MEBiC01747]
MRLIIAFDTNFKFNTTDTVIAKEKPSSIEDSQFIKVDALKEVDYVDDLEQLKDSLIKNYKSKNIRGSIYSSINNFNRNWILPLFKWVDTIDSALLKQTFTEIIIIGYTKNIGYIPYYEAEGEIGSKLLYSDYDAIPCLIEEYLKSKNINVLLKQKKSVFKLRIRVFIRRYILLIYKVIAFIKNKYKTRHYKNQSIDFNKIKFLFSTRSIAHSEYMFNFLKTYNEETIIHVSDGLHAGNKNLNFIENQKFKNVVVLYKTVSILKTISIFFNTVKALCKVKRNTFFEIKGIKINMSSVIKEMLISYFDALLYQASILSTIKDNKIKLITGEMYTPYAYTVSEIGKDKANTTIQLQTTAMMVRKEPNFVYCDKFLMNSKENAEALKNIYPKKANQIEYYGSLLYNEKATTQLDNKRELKKIVYFTQPLIEEDIEYLIIDKLIELERIYNYKTYIKLHPRERASKLERYNNKLNIIDNNLIFKEYISEFDLAVIRNTSLGSSIILEGIPIITCLLSETARNSKMDYIDHNYHGTIFSINELKNKISHFETLKTEFKSYRENYIQMNELTKGVHHFYNSL